VTRVLEEPTAAAIAYDLHTKPDVSQILVYDFGGGTLDVSILYVAMKSIEVYIHVLLCIALHDVLCGAMLE